MSDSTGLRVRILEQLKIIVFDQLTAQKVRVYLLDHGQGKRKNKVPILIWRL
ncbi:hypothetical protein [Thalassobacillus pellis]|uniref:hypothetical protein n=1 Tax=Thalassobacillus pellis TaxID=748008 RepID=UPI001960B545|nr:hypothetical protein [Thalassobacillus pellis]MBM7554446.1 hypothetical protein [Thalassobacillus pellis]